MYKSHKKQQLAINISSSTIMDEDQDETLVIDGATGESTLIDTAGIFCCYKLENADNAHKNLVTACFLYPLNQGQMAHFLTSADLHNHSPFHLLKWQVNDHLHCWIITNAANHAQNALAPQELSEVAACGTPALAAAAVSHYCKQDQPLIASLIVVVPNNDHQGTENN